MDFDIKNKRYITRIFKKVIETEYENKSTLGCVMMVKNEKKRILTSLNSLKGFIDVLIIYDTGSSDNTKELIINFCSENKISLKMIEGDFVNFEVSRNILLDYADTINVEFLLLLDCNDELQGGEYLIDFINFYKQKTNNCFLLKQVWFQGNTDSFKNIRLVRNRANIRYKGVVHEFINSPVDSEYVIVGPENVIIYQDRTQDDDKSSKRFYRDKILLYNEYKNELDKHGSINKALLSNYDKDNANNMFARTVFYLAQTCANLPGQSKEALYYYRLRSEMDKTFPEERYQSFLRLASLQKNLKFSPEDVIKTYMKAIPLLPDRIEPYLGIAKEYLQLKKLQLAYLYTKMACKLEIPENCLLYVDLDAYKATRWNLMAQICYECQEYDIGIDACIKAGDFVNISLYNSLISKKVSKNI